jgi:hypothetical protein
MKTMSIKANRMAAIVGFAVLCFSASAFGQNASVNFTGITTSQSFGGGYVPPYAGTVVVNGNTLDNHDLIICDDYYDEIFVPESWTANAVQASSLNAGDIGSTLFGDASTIDGHSVGGIGLSGYAAVADLVQQLFAAAPNSQAQVDLSSAIWYITSGDGATDGAFDSLNGNPLSAQATADVTNALAFGDSAAGIKALAADTNLWILTPNPNLGQSNPQEMWTEVPEGGAGFLYLLLAGIACFGAIRFSSRRQSAARKAA